MTDAVDQVYALAAGVDPVYALSAGADPVHALAAGVDPVHALSAGVDPVYALAAGFIAYWEGFSSAAYWDVNHYRLGFGSDTEGPRQVSVTKGMTTTRERALQNLALRIPQYEEVAKEQLGEALYDKLGNATKVAVLDMCYNYGDLPDSVLAAFLSNPVRVSAAIRAHESDNKKVNEDRRAGEAALVAFDGGQI